MIADLEHLLAETRCQESADEALQQTYQVAIEALSRAAQKTERYYVHQAVRMQKHTLFGRRMAIYEEVRSILTPCVYVVQLLAREACLKIGHSTHLRARMIDLDKDYGELACLFVIPHPRPAALERTIHSQFAHCRLYDKAAPSEIFCFNTLAKQKALIQCMHAHGAQAFTPPRWMTDVIKDEKQKHLF
jgi:hypothetical protein